MKNTDIIEALLERTSLEELTESENQAIVAEFGSKDKFITAWQANQKLKTEFGKDTLMEPSNRVKDSLDAILNARNSAKRVRMWQKHIPAYQAVAACFAIFVLSFAIKPEPEVQYQTRQYTKTEYIDRLIKDTVKIVQTKLVKIIAPAISVNTDEQYLASNTPDTADNQRVELAVSRNQFVGLDNLKLIENQRKGISIAEDTMLRQIRITRY